MKKRRTEIVLIVGLTLIALSAGVFAGVLAVRLVSVSRAGSANNGDHTFLSDELQLTATQRDEMRKIWEGVRKDAVDLYQKAQALQRERDEAIAKILTDQQKAQFEEISKKFANDATDINRQREELYAKAIEQTNGLLNETQRQKYEQILKERIGRIPEAPPNVSPSPPGERAGARLGAAQ